MFQKGDTANACLIPEKYIQFHLFKGTYIQVFYKINLFFFYSHQISMNFVNCFHVNADVEFIWDIELKKMQEEN